MRCAILTEEGPGEKDSVKSKEFRVRKGIPIMESENESFNLEDLSIFLNSVLEKGEVICHEEVIDLSNVETHLIVLDRALSFLRELYRPANDPRTGNDRQIEPQMIPDCPIINIEWRGPKFEQWISTLYTTIFFLNNTRRI